MTFYRRIIKEIRGLRRHPPEGYSCKISDNPFEEAIYLVMSGPDGSPYQGGSFKLTLEFSKDYPFQPPIVKFITPIYHPNVNIGGQICISPLNIDWTPGFTIWDILHYVRFMLTLPQIEQFSNAEIAFEYLHENETFKKKASDWTNRFAQLMDTENLAKLVERISLFEKDQAKYEAASRK